MSFQNICGDIGQHRHIFLDEMLSRRVLWLFGAQSVQGCAALTISGLCNAGCLSRAANHPSLQRRSIPDRTTCGRRIYLATPQQRCPLAVNLGVAAAGAMVFVNRDVIIQGRLGLTQSAVVLALASFGARSLVAAPLPSPWASQGPSALLITDRAPHQTVAAAAS